MSEEKNNEKINKNEKETNISKTGNKESKEKNEPTIVLPKESYTYHLDEPIYIANSGLSGMTIPISNPLRDQIYGVGSFGTTIRLPGTATLDELPNSYHISLGNELSRSTNELESQILKLRSDRQSLIDRLNAEEKTSKNYKQVVKELKNNSAELERRLSLGSLLSQVNSEASKKLFDSDEFLQLFEIPRNCKTYVLSIDIRRSTELMLKAKKPELFEKFIVSLCNKLSKVILDNYGVFDKFTGDGVLAFFPDFFSGIDAGLLAIKTALECHAVFDAHYKQNRNCFVSVLQDIGLGIGIDFGQTYLVKMNGSFTVIGAPVVYACRMSGAKAGDTLLNQNAFEDIFERYRQFFSFFETSVLIKNEGGNISL